MNQDSRRGFLATVARWGAVIGLGALVARLAGRTAGESDQTGPRDVCRRCRVLDACNRPDGMRTRTALGVAPGDRSPAPSWAGPPGEGAPPRERGKLGGRTTERGLCGQPPDGPLVSRWVRREDT
jgi:hypothetical protein